MAMYYNGKKVRNLYYNGKCITRLALGKEMTRLVEGDDFVSADWLCGRNGAFINTNYYLNTIEDSFDCHFRWDGATENPLGNLNGVFGNYSNNVFARVGIRYGKYFIDYKNADGSFNMLNIQSPYDAEIHLRSAVDKYSFEFNGTHYEYSNNAMEQIQLTLPVYVFENIAYNGSYFHGDIAYFNIEPNKVRMTPCRLLRPIPATLDGNGIARNAGECGMYDAVSGKFFGNVGSGTFTVSDN